MRRERRRETRRRETGLASLVSRPPARVSCLSSQAPQLASRVATPKIRILESINAFIQE